MLPKARIENLVVQEVGDELVVYDVARGRVHRLNTSTALVWRMCDGATMVADLTQALHHELGLPLDERYAWLALKQLDRARLLDRRIIIPAQFAGFTRREAIAMGMAGALVLLLPACESANGPTAAPGAVTLDLVGADVCRGKHDFAIVAPTIVDVSLDCVQRGHCSRPIADVYNDLCEQLFSAQCKGDCTAPTTCKPRWLASNNLTVVCEQLNPQPHPCPGDARLCRCYVRVRGGFARGGLVCECRCV
jgi:hypothetical protein